MSDCKHCREGFLDNRFGQDVECVNGILIDIDVARAGRLRPTPTARRFSAKPSLLSPPSRLIPMAEEQGLSAVNRKLIEREVGLPLAMALDSLTRPEVIDAILDLARSEGPQPPVVEVGEGVRERMQAFCGGAYLVDLYPLGCGALDSLRADVLSLLGSRHEG